MTNGASDGVSLSVQEARKKLESGGARAIDVRMPFDYAGGRIAGSLSLPNMSIRPRKGEVPADKELIFISDDGELSRRVCEVAKTLGFADVYNMEGGISAWIEADYPIETNSEGLTSALPTAE
jgi:rhodanese-related sulfurtransferase